MIVLLLGPPGAGKGTQAESLSAEFGFYRLDMGGLLREAMSSGSELGKQAKSYVDSGSLVPDELVVSLAVSKLAAMRENGERVLLDGFPRNLAQAQALVKAELEPDLVLDIRVPNEIIKDRISGRRLCRQCKRVYHVIYSPPKVEGVCDYCGGELYQRQDDRAELVEARLETYQQETVPLTEYYQAQGKLLALDGDDSPANISTRARQVIQNQASL
jgi:adenylate kinase